MDKKKVLALCTWGRASMLYTISGLYSFALRFTLFSFFGAQLQRLKAEQAWQKNKYKMNSQKLRSRMNLTECQK